MAGSTENKAKHSKVELGLGLTLAITEKILILTFSNVLIYLTNIAAMSFSKCIIDGYSSKL